MLRYKGFHGRGLIQLTWEDAYIAAGQAMGVNYRANPELLLQPLRTFNDVLDQLRRHALLVAEALREIEDQAVRGFGRGLQRILGALALADGVLPVQLGPDREARERHRNEPEPRHPTP